MLIDPAPASRRKVWPPLTVLERMILPEALFISSCEGPANVMGPVKKIWVPNASIVFASEVPPLPF